MLPGAILFDLIKAFAIKTIDSLSGAPPHISRPVLVHSLNTTIKSVFHGKYGKCL